MCIYRGVEQLVARRAHNPKVVGSSPSPATKSVTVVDTISATVILFIQKAGRRFFTMPRFLLNYSSGVRCGVRLFKAFRARLTKVRLRRRSAYASRPLERG